MSAKVDAFLSEVRNMPAFVTAAANDPKWLAEFDGLERGLWAVDRMANDDPAIIDILDKIQNVVGRSNLSLKERLLEVGRLLTQARDAMKIVH